MSSDKGSDIFKIRLGEEVKDRITGFRGIVISRSQWLTNCNTYGIKSQELKDNVPLDTQWFDEPTLETLLMSIPIVESNRETGGPEHKIPQTNR